MKYTMMDSDFLRTDQTGLDNDALHDELQALTEKVRTNMERFGTQFPSACSQNEKYRIKNNDDWTNGFWTGMQAIAYEFSGNEYFLDGVRNNVISFQERLKNHYVLDHHDIGFLYSLSAGAYYKITNDEDSKKLIVKAAEVLLKRFHSSVGFLQAWGEMNDPKEYRLIIDSLINLPILYQASEISQDEKYKIAANKHFHHVVSNIFRANYSSHHTFFFDTESGRPLRGETFQGFSDNSCWARGQAWAILGLPLNWRRGQIAPDKILYDKVCNYFLQHLPEDNIPYWDLSFTAADNQSRDTSALAIAICGLLEARDCFADDHYQYIAAQLLHQLKTFASASHDNECEGLIKHGVYAYSHNKGINECNLWGDYYYMEALYRLYQPDWKGYW